MNSHLHSVIFHILRPLVRILHRKGISFAEFSQIARQVYVETAEHSLIASDGKATTSRIAITTGLTRKDVAQLRKTTTSDELLAVRYNRGVRVISGWISDVEFQNAKGEPAKLLLQGADNSFENLVNRYSGDMPYRAMLMELQQSKLVEVSDNGSLTLLNKAYIPQSDETEKLSIMGRDVGLLITTIDHNLQPTEGKPPYFQRKVSYNNVPQDAADQFKQMVHQHGMSLLIKFNDWLAEHDLDTNPDASGSNSVMTGVGIYYFEEPSATATSPDHKDSDHAL
uniref:Uncharacterized protein n=1 Tax=uncultured Thiotrichaceae bacterium TaxID=298394 RepID=A0A6S6U6E0_9GAMM|nr:MAG: Unknown protein [uncultured Thiotrichaceae bacterium]